MGTKKGKILNIYLGTKKGKILNIYLELENTIDKFAVAVEKEGRF